MSIPEDLDAAVLNQAHTLPAAPGPLVLHLHVPPDPLVKQRRVGAPSLGKHVRGAVRRGEPERAARDASGTREYELGKWTRRAPVHRVQVAELRGERGGLVLGHEVVEPQIHHDARVKRYRGRPTLRNTRLRGGVVRLQDTLQLPALLAPLPFLGTTLMLGLLLPLLA